MYICSLEAIISTEQLTCRKFKHHLSSFILIKSIKVPDKKKMELICNRNVKKNHTKIIHIDLLNFR